MSVKVKTFPSHRGLVGGTDLRFYNFQSDINQSCIALGMNPMRRVMVETAG